MANVSLFVNPEQVGRILLLCWKATRLAQQMGLSLRVPVALVGDTGCGKTEAVKLFHKMLSRQINGKVDPVTKQKIDLKLYTMILSLVPAEDIGGYPSVDKTIDKLVHRMMACMPFDSDDWGIVFQDELDRATPETQNAALQFLLGGEYHGHRISKNAFTISALNGTADVYTVPLSQAARTRVCTIFMSRQAAGGSKSYDNWAIKMGLPQVCRAFNEQFASQFHKTEAYEEMAVCTPRTLDMCGLVTLARQQVEAGALFETEDIYYPIIAGLIGMTAGAHYIGLEKVITDGLDPYAVIDNPEETDLMDDPSMVFYLIQATCNIIRDKYECDRSKIRAVARYGMRHENDEWKEIWMTALLKEFPDFSKDKVYQNWVSKKRCKGIGIM